MSAITFFDILDKPMGLLLNFSSLSTIAKMRLLNRQIKDSIDNGNCNYYFKEKIKVNLSGKLQFFAMAAAPSLEIFQRYFRDIKNQEENLQISLTASDVATQLLSKKCADLFSTIFSFSEFTSALFLLKRETWMRLLPVASELEARTKDRIRAVLPEPHNNDPIKIIAERLSRIALDAPFSLLPKNWTEANKINTEELTQLFNANISLCEKAFKFTYQTSLASSNIVDETEFNDAMIPFLLKEPEPTHVNPMSIEEDTSLGGFIFEESALNPQAYHWKG